MSKRYLKCVICGRKCHIYEMCCLLSLRGANSYCLNHKDFLICSYCAKTKAKVKYSLP